MRTSSARAILPALLALAAVVSAQDTEISLPVTIEAPAFVRTISATVRVDASGELLAVDGPRILATVDGVVAAATERSLVRAAGDGWLTVQELADAGLPVDWDAATLTTTVRVPMDVTALQPFDITARRRLPPYQRVAPARFSVALPQWGELSQLFPQGRPAVTSYRWEASPAISLLSWVLEGSLTGSGSDAAGQEPTFEYSGVRLIRDWDGPGIRLQLGQIAPPPAGPDAGRPLLGAAIDNVRADNERTTVEALFDEPFVVDAPGTLEIELNGRRIRSEPVVPGRYELGNLAVPPGTNVVTVIYRREDGTEERTDLVIPYGGGLVKPGRLAYAGAAGVVEEDLGRPAGYGLLRYGVSSVVTAGVSAGATTTGVEVGLDGTAATRIGQFSLAGYGTTGRGGTLGWAARGGYRLNPAAQSWVPVLGVSAEYRTARYGVPELFQGGVDRAWQVTSSVSQRIPGSLGLSVSHVYRSYHDDIDPSSFLYGSLSRRFGGGVSARIGGFVDLEAPDTWGLGLVVTWQSSRRGISAGGSVDARTQVADLSVSAVGTGRLSATAGVRAIDPITATVDGGSATVRYAGSRIEVGGRGSVSFADAAGPGDLAVDSLRWGARLGLGLYFADGAFSIARPVRGAVALVRPDRDLPAESVSVERRSGSGARPHRSGFLGAAVVGPLPDTQATPIVVTVPGLPVDYSLGATSFIVDPRYRSATVLTITSTRRYYVRGTLVGADGTPVEYVGLRITPRFEPPEAAADIALGGTSFTDETGLFESYDLIPGEYEGVLLDGSQRRFAFTVRQQDAPLVELGPISVGGEE